MKAKPMTTAAELKKKLPQRLGGAQKNSSDGLEHHAQLDALDADPLTRVVPPDANGENRAIAAEMRSAMKRKINDNPGDPKDPKGPRFVMMWRMYPNQLNAHVATTGQCGCGCSCVG